MKKIIILVIALTAVLMLCACGSTAAPAAQSGKTQAVAVLVGNHACSQELNLNSPVVKDTVSSAIRTYGFVSVINVDGDPDLVSAANYDIPSQYKKADRQKLEQDARNKSLLLLQTIQGIEANSPEVDTLGALRMAVRSFSAAPEDAEKTILVIDSGLSTAGYCNFVNNLLNAEPEAIVAALADRGALPNLRGIRVIWQQLGDTAYPQGSLTPAQVQQLVEIWKAVIEACGGSFELSDIPPNSTSLDRSLPPVSVVELAADPPIAFASESVHENRFAEPVYLAESQVRFLGDSAAYAEPDAAIETLTPIAEYLAQDESLHLLLVGSTAGDGYSEFSMTLSKNRAETVKRTLVSLGVGEERLSTLGLGCMDPWHIGGVGTEGELAAMNRKVVLIDAQTQIARELLKESV